VQSDDRLKSARKKRLAIRQKEQKVEQARHNLMQAETALATEELPDLTGG